MAPVTLTNVRKSFGTVEAVRDVSLAIADRELVVFVGPSGCGKSTLLRMIAGLEDIDSGELRIADRRMNAVHPADRGVAMVFQSYALYPHMNVAQNLAFGLKMSGVGRAEIDRRVKEAAAILQIEPLLQRRPKALSGGQRQRVAIGRAIVRDPGVFLFDEPLSNLDADLRAQMRVEIARLHARLDTTMIYVTHDQVEAMTLADRIVVLNGGRIEQVGAPVELYDRPANLFVAGFLGQPKMNFVSATLRAEDDAPVLSLGAGGPALPLPAGAPPPVAPGGAVTAGIRPDAIAIRPGGGDGAVAAQLELVERLGSDSLAHVRVPGIAEGLTVETKTRVPSEPGTALWLGIDPAEIHLFGPDGVRLGRACESR
jgi:multiple sugar transport system ATP-binding protein